MTNQLTTAKSRGKCGNGPVKQTINKLVFSVQTGKHNSSFLRVQFFYKKTMTETKLVCGMGFLVMNNNRSITVK